MINITAQLFFLASLCSFTYALYLTYNNVGVTNEK